VNDWVEIGDASNEAEAHLAAGRLEEAGIETQLVPSVYAPGAWLTGARPQWTPVRILVPPQRAAEARSLLDEIADSAPAVPEAFVPSWRWAVAVVVLVVIVLTILANQGTLF
jgi:hypothetical protein